MKKIFFTYLFFIMAFSCFIALRLYAGEKEDINGAVAADNSESGDADADVEMPDVAAEDALVSDDEAD